MEMHPGSERGVGWNREVGCGLLEVGCWRLVAGGGLLESGRGLVGHEVQSEVQSEVQCWNPFEEVKKRKKSMKGGGEGTGGSDVQHAARV